jgi:AcrR family transcriptional regulator
MENRKLQIINNLASEFLKQGIRNVTMDNVSAEFGMSKKTLYRYFANKEELVEQVIDHIMNTHKFDYNDQSVGNAIDILYSMRTQMTGLLRIYHHHIETELKKDYPVVYQKVHAFKRQRIIDNTVNNLKMGMAQGLYRNDIDLTFVAKLQLGRILYTMHPDSHIFEDYEIHSEAFYLNAIDYHLHAICTEKGLQYYYNLINKVQNESNN